MDRFVTIATYNYAYETIIPKAILESEGILCFVRDEHTMYIQPFFSSTGGGIKLQVASEDAEDALKIIQETESGSEMD
jgi:Putative prokaryotic signal transducing protein